WMPSILLVLTLGCSQKLMPTPAVYRAGGLDPFLEVRPEDRTTQVPIYYITDREPSGNSSIGDYYSGSRSKDLRVGQATVQLGSPDQSWEDLCRESQLEKRGNNPRVAVTDLSEYGVLWTREFPADLKRPVELPSS